MNHSPEECKICGKYHCLAGCVPVEECIKESEIERERIIAWQGLCESGQAACIDPED